MILSGLVLRYHGNTDITLFDFFSDLCREEVVYSTHKGYVEWPETRVNTSVRVSCPHNVGSDTYTATRQCVLVTNSKSTKIQWALADTDNCPISFFSRELQRVYLIMVCVVFRKNNDKKELNHFSVEKKLH